MRKISFILLIVSTISFGVEDTKKGTVFTSALTDSVSIETNSTAIEANIVQYLDDYKIIVLKYNILDEIEYGADKLKWIKR